MAVTFRMWQVHVREVEERAQEAERTRDEAARRRAVEERLRIARDLHDSLTHSISVIQVQAGVAVHLARKRGEELPPALLAIEEAGADAARELRATLGVLRAAEDGDGSGLAHLDSLISRTRAAGQPVTVTVTGTARPLPPDVDQAAYRIVQEALTNVSRHAGSAGGNTAPAKTPRGNTARASVRLAYETDTLTVEVDDDGDGSRPVARGELSLNGDHANHAPGPGLGLIGMRERVSALGGRLHAGPLADGGFRVRVEIPVPIPS